LPAFSLLPACQDEFDRHAQAITKRVNLQPNPPLERPSASFSAELFAAPAAQACALMTEDFLPDAIDAPSRKALEDAIPFTIRWRQYTPLCPRT